MFHEDISKWMKDKKKMVKFIKKVLNVARECPDQTSEKRTTSSNSSRAPINVNDEDDDPDNIGKIIKGTWCAEKLCIVQSDYICFVQTPKLFNASYYKTQSPQIDFYLS